MTISAEFAFIRAIALPRAPDVSLLRHRNLFHATHNTGALRRLGASLDDSLVPELLRPTNVVEQELARRMKRWGFDIAGTRQPFKTQWEEQATELRFSVKLIPPRILVVRLDVSGLAVGDEDLASKLISLQRGFPERLLPPLPRSVVAMISGADHRADENTVPLPSGGTLPVVHLQAPVSVPGVVDWADVRRVSLGAAVLRDSDYETSDRVIVDSLHDRNQELNRKGGFRRLLSKQGALLISSAADQRSSTELKRLVDLASIAVCLRRFFETYPAGRAEAPAYYDFLLGKAVTWVEDPDRVFRDSVTSEHTWRVAAGELRLDKDVERLLEQQSVRDRLASVRDNTRGFDQGWWANANLAAELQDVLVADGGTSVSTQQVVTIMHAAQVQVAARDISNFHSFAEFTDALEQAVDALVGVEPAAKEEAKGLIAKLRNKGDGVATAAAGGAGGAVLGAVLKQLLGLP